MPYAHDITDPKYSHILQLTWRDSTVDRFTQQWLQMPEVSWEMFLEALVLKLIEDKEALQEQLTTEQARAFTQNLFQDKRKE